MNRARLIGLSLLLAGAFGAAQAQDGLPGGPAHPETRDQDSGLTRAQVRAETLRAIRDGDIPRSETGVTPAEQFPQVYAAVRQRDGLAPSAPSTLTRADVKAELAAAVKAGNVQVGDEGHTLAELNPSRYPHDAAAPGLTRAQVRAETLQAIRDGDIPQGDTGTTPAQQFPQRYAAARARDGEPRYAMN